MVDTCPTLRSGGNRTGGDRPPGTDVDTADSLIATFNNTEQGWFNDTDIASGLRDMSAGSGSKEATLIAHALRADGFDASEDGTGRGTPIVAETLRSHPRPGSNSIGAVIPTQTQEYKCCMDVGNEPCNACPKLKDAIGFRATGQDGYLPSEISPPLCSTDGGGTIPSIAFTERGRDQGRTFEAQEELAYALCNPGSGGRTHSRQIFTPMMAVRRLTPLECTRLQGFADDFFDHVLYRGKPPADGPIYKALGNSMAVPVIAWIGKRIAFVSTSEAANGMARSRIGTDAVTRSMRFAPR